MILISLLWWYHCAACAIPLPIRWCCCYDAASRAMILPPPWLLLFRCCCYDTAATSTADSILLYHRHFCYCYKLPTNSAAVIHHPMLLLRLHCRRRLHYDATGATIHHWNIPPLSLLFCRCYSVAAILSLLFYRMSLLSCWLSLLCCRCYAVAAMLSLLCCRCYAVDAILLMLYCWCYAAHNTAVATTPIQQHNSSVILWHYHLIPSMAASSHWQLMLIVGACYL